MSEQQQTPRDQARAALDAVTPALLAGMRAVLNTPVERLNIPWGVAEFEVDPMYFGVHAVALDEPVLPDLTSDVLPTGIFDNEAVYEVIAEMMMERLAEVWQDAGGELFPVPGQAFLHGYPERYDFRTRQWVKD